MRYRNKKRVFCWIFIWSHLQIVTCEEISNGFVQSSNDNPITKDLRGLFSPRMDYDQWKPLGRGDPLKNDPTYDYVPPVLDRVHYWIDPALRKPDPPIPGENQKTEILLLGVSSKKTSTGTSLADSRKDNYDSFLKFVDGPKFTTQRNPRPHYPVTSFFPNNFYTKNKNVPKTEQRVPYTMLVPPPLITNVPNSVTQKYNTIQTTTADPETVTSTVSPEINTITMKSDADVTVQTANLIYHSSSFSDASDWWTTESSTNLTPTPSKNLVPFKESIVFQNQQLPDKYIQTQFEPHNLSEPFGTNSDHTINYVTPPPLINKEVMHKGEVSDDNLDISNTYVKIGKTEAQVHSTGMDNIPVIPPEMLFGQVPNMGFSPMSTLTQAPMTMQSIQSLQSMQPPAVTTSPVFKRPTNPIKQALDDERATTVPPLTETTTTAVTASLTTNPVLKHFKPPIEHVKNPVYLIIQGHSKVKTYGPSKQFHGISVQETNEIPDEKEESNVKHLHYMKNDRKDKAREARSGNLETLKHVILTKLGAIDFRDVGEDGVKEAEVHFGYKVGDDVTSEKYYKGIVEEARKLRMEN